jgi:hypothetical protein
VRIQTFQILTQRLSCTLSGCSWAVPTHSLAFMCTYKHSGRNQCSHKDVHNHSIMFRGVFNTHSKASCALTSIQGPLSFRTQMRSFSWSHYGESHSIMNQWHSCALNGWPHSLKGVHAHSMMLFPLTYWCSCTLNGCSGDVPTHPLAFTCTHKCSRGVTRSE